MTSGTDDVLVVGGGIGGLTLALELHRVGVPVRVFEAVPQVTQVGDFVFRICFIDPFQGSVMAKFARNTLKAETAAILWDVKSDYSKGLQQFFKETFPQLGGRVVAEPSTTRAATTPPARRCWATKKS